MTVPGTTAASKQPSHGWTKVGNHVRPVHARVVDHLPTNSAYQRFNKKVALALTKYVGTMTCFWVFCLLALCSLPAVLSGFHVFRSAFPAVLIKTSIIALVAWVAQTFLQLVLLPSLMVGQNLQNEAADVRAAKTFDDAERIIHALDLNEQGGLSDLRNDLHAYIDSKFPTPTSQ
ncbi:MAG: hypothetical protein ABSG81_12025 [Acidimicrobiales bacterium]|jgi:hypothetical protein